MPKRAQLRFEMPYQVDAPMLTDEASGIDRVRLRSQHSETVTRLFDTADERLLRAGVQLLHRADGQEVAWQVRAGRWQRWVDSVDWAAEASSEVPEPLAQVLAPLRRRAALTTIASVVTERAEYTLYDVDGQDLGAVLDDRVTVRRSGLAVTRRRQVTLAPNPEMTPVQRAVIADRLMMTGGRRAATFGDPLDLLIDALGMGQEDEAGASAEELVARLLRQAQAELIEADLDHRIGQVASTDRIVEVLGDLRHRVEGLTAILDPGWAGELRWEIDRAVQHATAGERDAHFEVLDRLSSGIRAPRVRIGEDLDVILRRDGTVRLNQLIAELRALATEDEAWGRALASARSMDALVTVADGRIGKTTAFSRRLGKLINALNETVVEIPTPTPDQVAALDPWAAYELGRTYQARLEQVCAPRTELLDGLDRAIRRLTEAWVAPLDEPEEIETPDEVEAADE